MKCILILFLLLFNFQTFFPNDNLENFYNINFDNNIFITDVDFYSNDYCLITTINEVINYNLNTKEKIFLFKDSLNIFEAKSFENKIIYSYGYYDDSYVFIYNTKYKTKEYIPKLSSKLCIYKDLSWKNDNEFFYISNDTKNIDTELFDGEISFLQNSSKSNIYFQNLYKYNIKSKKNQLIKANVSQYKISNENIIYLSVNDDKYTLFKINLIDSNLNEIINLNVNSELLFYDGQYIFICENRKLVKINIDNLEKNDVSIDMSSFNKLRISPNKKTFILYKENGNIVSFFSKINSNTESGLFFPTIRNLRFRKSPKNGKFIRLLDKSEKLELLEKGDTETIGGAEGTWVKVKTEQGEIGWCFDAYLEPWMGDE